MPRLLFLILPLLCGMMLPPGDWQQVTSEACQASFALPGTAQPDTTTQSYGEGKHLTLYTYEVVDGRDLYDVTCGIYPSKSLSTAEQRRTVLTTMTERLKKKGKVDQSKKIKIANRPGRQVVVAVKDGMAYQYHRLVVTDHRLIIMTAGRWAQLDPAEDSSLQQFFGSLELR